jgi:hypothetical protein
MKTLTLTKAVTLINCVYSHYRRLNEAVAKARRAGLDIQLSATPPELVGIEGDSLSADEKASVEYYFLEKGSNDGIAHGELTDAQIERQDLVDNTIVEFFADHENVPDDEDITALVEGLNPFKANLKKDKTTWGVISCVSSRVRETAVSIDYSDSVVSDAVDQIRVLLMDYFASLYRRRVDMEFYPSVS